jgi:DNA repair ATPase RecN
LIGERGSSDLIRSGADELRVTGLFELNRPDLRRAVEAVLEDARIIVANSSTRSSSVRSGVMARAAAGGRPANY